MKKFRENRYTCREVRQISDELCEKYGLSIVIPSQKRRSQLYSRAAFTSWRKILKNDIDRCLEESGSYEEFLEKMQNDYYVKSSGKYLSFRHRTNGQQRNIRSYSLGEDYSESAIRSRIAGTYPTPLKDPETQSFSRNIRDVQSKFHAYEILTRFDTLAQLE